MQTLRQWMDEAALSLLDIYDEREAANVIAYLVEEFMQLNAAQITLISRNEIEKTTYTLLGQNLHRLQQREPLQYILGNTHFYGMQLQVAPGVLIPRPETEELVEWILEENQNPNLTVLDIGTGSGCIPLALKQNRPTWQVATIDDSNDALTIAKANAQQLNLAVNFSQVDFLDSSNWANMPNVDLLVSNPPYITTDEFNVLEGHVKEYEPQMALIANHADPLIFYRQIAAFAKQKLNSGGAVYLELNAAKATETDAIFQQAGFKTQLKQDLQGKNRMLKFWQ